MNLSKLHIKNIDPAKVNLPAADYFQLPEKVLQFGMGALLRGLPDYYIDKANKQGIFNGRVVVVKSTTGGDADAFRRQDGLYTLCSRGIINGETVEENIVSAAISRVLSAKSEWQAILACAANPDLEVVISNTTEVGLVLQPDDDIRSNPPDSFPGKLLAILYERYKVFNGAKDKGLVIVPTELVPGNGDLLESIMEELAHRNNLDYQFIDWLENCNYFCNSLVDRIVPGKLPTPQQTEIEQELGYKDHLMIISEPYHRWLIEADTTVAKKLSFAEADGNIVISEDIAQYKELKLRILNGAHTVCCGLAYLAGYHTVQEAMADDQFSGFLTRLIYQEIIPSVVDDNITEEAARSFAETVIERFSNPYIEHQWLTISMQYSSKLRLRVLPVIARYYERENAVPSHIALGFAAYILFMNTSQDATGKVWGKLNERNYQVSDSKASLCVNIWSRYTGKELVQQILANEELWGMDLNTNPGFTSAVTEYLEELQLSGANAALGRFSGFAVAV